MWSEDVEHQLSLACETGTVEEDELCIHGAAMPLPSCAYTSRTLALALQQAGTAWRDTECRAEASRPSPVQTQDRKELMPNCLR